MNGFLYRSVLCAAQALGRASIAAVFISLVACGGGGSGGGGDGGDGRRPVVVAPPTNSPNPSTPSDPTVTTTPTVSTPPPPNPPAAAASPPATVLTLNNQKAKTFSFSWPASAGATEYRLEEFIPGNPDFVQVTSLGGSVLNYDLAVPFLPSKINASYRLQSCTDGACSFSPIISITPDDLRRAIGYVKTSNTPVDPPRDANGKLPVVIAANNDVMDLSADGKTLAIGEFVEDGLGTGIEGALNGKGQTIGDRENNSGAVYVFVNKDGVWSQQAYIKASNSRPDLDFGMSVSLSADGNTLAVGALEETIFVKYTGTIPPQGAVYMFTRSGTTWGEQQILKADNAGTHDLFGGAVSLSDDGNTVAVGAAGEDSKDMNSRFDNSVMDSGAAYIFTRDVTTLKFSQTAYLKAPTSDVAQSSQFGGTLSLSGDGQTLAVAGGGAVYVFASNGTGWTIPPTTLKGPFQNGSLTVNSADFFGGSISLSRDGRTLATGASQFFPFADPPTNSGPGTVFVFARGDGNNWTIQTALKGSKNGDAFYTASLTDDGNTLLIGAYRESSAAKGISVNAATDTNAPASGAAYLYTRNGTSWSQKLYLKASNTEAGDGFGFAIAIAGDGSTLAVMAPYEASSATGVGGNQDDNTAFAGGGAVYLY